MADASARELRSGWGPKEKDELMEWRGPVGWLVLLVRDPDGEGARGIAKPVEGVAAMARSSKTVLCQRGWAGL